MVNPVIASGFLSVGGKEVYRVVERINSPTLCLQLVFRHLSPTSKSPLVGPNAFDLVQTGLYNGRPAWSNGDTYVSYVPAGDDSSATHGSWLVGAEPGVDSGFGYFKPTHTSIVPVGLEGGRATWHWLEASGWEKAPAVRLECADEVPYGAPFFYDVEYFAAGDRAVRTLLAPAPAHERALDTLVVEDYFPSIVAPSLWNEEEQRWAPLSGGAGADADGDDDDDGGSTIAALAVVCAFGAPTAFTDAAGASTVGHLIGQVPVPATHHPPPTTH
jgi:hypothetical protein